MLGVYEVGERGSVKGAIKIEQSSSHKNLGLI
jgi:hypothetical protein